MFFVYHTFQSSICTKMCPFALSPSRTETRMYNRQRSLWWIGEFNNWVLGQGWQQILSWLLFLITLILDYT